MSVHLNLQLANVKILTGVYLSYGVAITVMCFPVNCRMLYYYCYEYTKTDHDSAFIYSTNTSNTPENGTQ